jgi:hypothetical protein
LDEVYRSGGLLRVIGRRRTFIFELERAVLPSSVFRTLGNAPREVEGELVTGPG